MRGTSAKNAAQNLATLLANNMPLIKENPAVVEVHYQIQVGGDGNPVTGVCDNHFFNQKRTSQNGGNSILSAPEPCEQQAQFYRSYIITPQPASSTNHYVAELVNSLF